jgi:hypothetical protein
MKLYRAFEYYSMWAMVFHLMCDETYWMAIFVKYVGNAIVLIKFLMGKSSIAEVAFVLIGHELPFYLKDMGPEDNGKELLVFSLYCYVFLFDFYGIYNLYMNKNVIDYVLLS